VSIDLSTAGVARGATVLVATGIITIVAAGELPFSSLANRGASPRQVPPE
jgi:hypothetical protein